MIKLTRPDLPQRISDKLDKLQEEVNECVDSLLCESLTHEERVYFIRELVNNYWDYFSESEYRLEKKRPPQDTVRKVLTMSFHSKCAYCESPRGKAIEHYWPKQGTPENDNRGSHLQLFRWENYLLSCDQCNEDYKRSKMKWGSDHKPLLINPCDEDPADYLLYDFRVDSRTTFGWIVPIPNLRVQNPEKFSKAKYTVRLLHLDDLRDRSDLVLQRVDNYRRFWELVSILRNFGPDCSMSDNGRNCWPLRQSFQTFLDVKEPERGMFRYLFQSDQSLCVELITAMPELIPVIQSWL